MQYKENKKSKFDNFLAGKGFYAVLAICVLTVALATYLTVAKLGNNEKPKDTSSINSGEIKINSEKVETSKPAQNVTESEPYSSQTVSESKSETAQNTVAEYFVIPVAGEILKDYSDTVLQYSTTYNDMRLHLGIDVAAAEGTAIKSAGDGMIISVAETKDYGNVVTVDHGNEIITKYCGLKNLTINSGDIVTAGQVLGEVGTVPAECVDKTHLHFEVYRNSKPVSPMQIIEEFLNN